MAIIKCKMCGGDLNIVEGSTVAECEYCGTKQTVPSAGSEKKLTLFGRAGRLLRACEFDKAAGVFESIVADFPEEAEAYWGLVLCKYGIEYVDDPATGRKIPTCHRSSFDSVMDDENFDQACENADSVARRLSREEAKAIEELRRGIIEVSGKEAPYDVFICYKETGEDGERTLDSVLAQDIYDALTEKGYRVFFSRVTLEDKLGQEYEPYIFAALNSAKVMLAVGTDYDHYNAVWVKNEWSRFLQLIASGQKKTLIPCYKGIDAYDMPKEFAKLQAQDLGKVGAMQDLLRGVDKILGKGAQGVQAPAASSGPSADSLCDRGEMFLEDADWAKADEYFDKALDINPKMARAYLGKLLAAARAKNFDALAKSERKFETDPLYQKAQRFAQGADLDALNAFRASLHRAEQEREAKQRDNLRRKAEEIVRREREKTRELQEQAKQTAEIREIAQKKLANLQAKEHQLKEELDSLRGLFTAKRRKEIEAQLTINLAQQSGQRLRLDSTPAVQPPLPVQDQRSDQELVEEWLAKMLNSDVNVCCPMPGTILRVCVSEGQPVKKGGTLLILEAMKMENEIMAPRDGVVTGIYVAEGQRVETGELLASIVHTPTA